MYVSTTWLNDYLDPPATAQEQAELLTRAGFPLEGRKDVGGDVCQDFEMTSNRGDCVCHLGLAREIAAISGRSLKPPSAPATPSEGPAHQIASVTNHEHDLCPLYTARIIRGLEVGPSPEWLAERLRTIGQIPRNNLVDAANFVLFELGQPTHVFDLATLKGPAIIIRSAAAGEPFLPIGEGSVEVKLTVDDLVIADAERAVAIGGVKGGAVTAVTDSTTDILIEAATFDHVTVRNSSRRHNIASESSYRYERGVHPAQVNPAADRLTAMILELCGGELVAGVVADGKAIPERRTATMRPSRCRAIMGVEMSDEQMVQWLDTLGFEPALDGDRITCLVPVHRLDIEREVDLIEEVGRMYGHDNIPISDTLEIRVAPLQPTERARQAVANVLVGEGYIETVTHSLISEAAAEAFMPAGARGVRVADDRAKAEPVLQPSVLPGLLRVRAHNRDNGVDDVSLFETASTVAMFDGSHRETVNVAFIQDLQGAEQGLRTIRGVIDRLAELLVGPEVAVDVTADNTQPWYDPGAAISINGDPIGFCGVITQSVAALFGLNHDVVAAELELPRLYDGFPPEREAHTLPTFPVVERDISAVVAEATRWADIRTAIDDCRIGVLEAVEFVTTYRSEKIGADRKSVTIRLRFRATDRTLTNDDVDVHAEAVMTTLQQQLNAEIRK